MSELNEKFVVVDTNNDLAVGPFDSRAEATAYIKSLATMEGWADTLDLISKTGSPFGNADLTLVSMAKPDAGVLGAIRSRPVVKAKLIEFFNHLTANTDTFDKVMVQIERDLGDDHILSSDLVENLVDEFLSQD